MKLNIDGLKTESRNDLSMNLDSMTPLEIVTLMNQEDACVPKAVGPQLENIARCIGWTEKALTDGGRIVYMGAGTSGRLGVLDAAECPPTFGVEPEQVVGLIAGGEKAIVTAVEGAEDDPEAGKKDLERIALTGRDVVIGLAASGRTPYVIGGLRYASSLGCHTAGISCNPGSAVGKEAELAIEVVTGPEILTGSTRLKAGSAQKMILNMISTGTMVRIGKVYQNLMVDLMPTNEKLRVRAENIVMQATGAGREEAASAIAESGSAKAAIVMLLTGCTAQEATEKLKKNHGRIRSAEKGVF